MAVLHNLLYGILGMLVLVAGIANIVSFILLVVQMFQHNRSGLGIACVVLALCYGVGGIIALVVGWRNADRWGIRRLMKVYTGSIIAIYALLGAGWLISLTVPAATG